MALKDMVGKKLVKVEDDATNCMVLVFEDGTKFEIFAECGSGDFSIPFFDIYEGVNDE